MTLDGNMIASGHFDGALRFWDVRSGREARTMKGLHEQQICSVAVGHLGGESWLRLGSDACAASCITLIGVSHRWPVTRSATSAVRRDAAQSRVGNGPQFVVPYLRFGVLVAILVVQPRLKHSVCIASSIGLEPSARHFAGRQAKQVLPQGWSKPPLHLLLAYQPQLAFETCDRLSITFAAQLTLVRSGCVAARDAGDVRPGQRGARGGPAHLRGARNAAGAGLCGRRGVDQRLFGPRRAPRGGRCWVRIRVTNQGSGFRVGMSTTCRSGSAAPPLVR